MSPSKHVHPDSLKNRCVQPVANRWFQAKCNETVTRLSFKSNKQLLI